MKALVTGAGGFIGSHLTELLLDKGWEVNALVRYNSKADIGYLKEITQKSNRKFEIFSGDIRDAGLIKEAAAGCDVIFNLAALIGIPYSYLAPESYLYTNVHGCMNILEYAKYNKGIKIVQTSTSEVYGTAQFVPITEQHPLVGQSPYAATKIAADQLALSYEKSFDIDVTIARPFNTYGPRQSMRAVLPTIAAQCLNPNQKVIKLGSLRPTRDFNYVKDTCRGFLAIAESNRVKGETINIASQYEVSIGECVEIIQGLIGTKKEVITDDQRKRPEKSEVYRLFGSNELIQKMTSWKPEYSGVDGLERGLKNMIKWMELQKGFIGDSTSYMV